MNRTLALFVLASLLGLAEDADLDHTRFQEEIPGAIGQPHTTIRGAGHFVQEDAGEELARIALDFIARTRGSRSGSSGSRSP